MIIIIVMVFFFLTGKVNRRYGSLFFSFSHFLLGSEEKGGKRGRKVVETRNFFGEKFESLVKY